jgi:outer membrane protein OmpA-like peptidoglycan-associated protein
MINRFSFVYISIIYIALCSCGGNVGSDSSGGEPSSAQNSSGDEKSKVKGVLTQSRKAVKMGHHINTAANEYLPVLTIDETGLFFSAMDRTGFFDFKIDFTKQKSAGGEDIYFSELKDGVWVDSRPISSLNTNGHECVSQVLENGNLMITANYPEKLGPKNSNNGTETTDLFLAKRLTSTNYGINHFPEPVNSIYSEADGFTNSSESFILFVSDRPGHVGDYHKKGWKWNNNFWGNTDVYVSVKNGDYWAVPVNLGGVVNTQGAERTPWLSADGLTLFVSSNGQRGERTDLDIYAFKRSDINNWLEWDGPYAIEDANTEFDDWGYKETVLGNAYLARVIPLGFKPTQGGSAGDGGIRETNFRTGYEVFGQQVASLLSENTTDIYFLQRNDLPTFSLPDVLFEFDSYKLNNKMLYVLDRLLDVLKQNSSTSIEVKGFTDDIGDDNYNQVLSQKRAESVKNYLQGAGVSNSIDFSGFGEQFPRYQNINEANRMKNRRVEIFFK